MNTVDIGTTRFTKIKVVDESGDDGACNSYEIIPSEEETFRISHLPIAQIQFQNGPVPDKGVNGIFIEDLLAICIHRLNGFQTGKLACTFNANAVEHIELALQFLQARTEDRKDRGVEGTTQR